MNSIISLILIILIIAVLAKNTEHMTTYKANLNKFKTNDCRPQKYIFADQIKIFKNDCITKVEKFTNSKLNNVPKKIWIYYPYKTDSTQWVNFGDRLNQQPKPELFNLTVSKIKKTVGITWSVIVLDQTNIQNYIKLPQSLYDNELLIQAAILNKYGGIWLPSYTFILNDMTPLLKYNIVFPVIDGFNNIVPIVSKPNQSVWNKLINYILENPNNKSDFSDFTKLNELMTQCPNVLKVDGQVMGLTDADNKFITFVNLSSNYPTIMSEKSFMVAINRSEELRRETQFLHYYTKTHNEIWLDNLLS